MYFPEWGCCEVGDGDTCASLLRAHRPGQVGNAVLQPFLLQERTPAFTSTWALAEVFSYAQLYVHGCLLDETVVVADGISKGFCCCFVPNTGLAD